MSEATATPVESGPVTEPSVEPTTEPTSDPGTVLDNTDPSGPSPTAFDWPEHISKYAKGDEKVASRLSRYSSLDAALDSIFAADKRISQGDMGVKRPGENAGS